MEIIKGLLLIILSLVCFVGSFSLIVIIIVSIIFYIKKVLLYYKVKRNIRKYKLFRKKNLSFVKNHKKCCENCIYVEHHCTMLRNIHYSVCLRYNLDDIFFPESEVCNGHRFDVKELEKELFEDKIGKR